MEDKKYIEKLRDLIQKKIDKLENDGGGRWPETDLLLISLNWVLYKIDKLMEADNEKP